MMAMLSLITNEPRAPGQYQVGFDASALSSGVYVYRLMAGSFVNSAPTPSYAECRRLPGWTVQGPLTQGVR